MKSRAKVHIGLAIALGAILASLSGGYQIALAVVVTILVVSSAILYFNEKFSSSIWKRLVSIANGIEVGYIAIALGLVGLGIVLIPTKVWWLGILFILIGFWILGRGIGKNTLRIRQAKDKH